MRIECRARMVTGNDRLGRAGVPDTGGRVGADRCGGAHGVDSPPVHYPTRRRRTSRRTPASPRTSRPSTSAQWNGTRRTVRRWSPSRATCHSWRAGRQNATGSEPPPSARPVSRVGAASGGRAGTRRLPLPEVPHPNRCAGASPCPGSPRWRILRSGNLIAVCRPCHRELHDTRTPRSGNGTPTYASFERCSTSRSPGSMS